MADIEESLQKVMSVEGAIGAALIDSSTGFVFGMAGDELDMQAAGTGGVELVRAKIKTVKALNPDEIIEDILITMGQQYHIIRPVALEPDLFLYLVLDKSKSNLAIARLFTADVGSDIFA